MQQMRAAMQAAALDAAHRAMLERSETDSRTAAALAGLSTLLIDRVDALAARFVHIESLSAAGGAGAKTAASPPMALSPPSGAGAAAPSVSAHSCPGRQRPRSPPWRRPPRNWSS
jgi:hypothetical protein